MATFTITTTQNIDALTGKTGGDVYNVNGGTLVIDQDSRFGLNNANTSATAATSMAAISISATLGGIVNIDARNVMLIPFTGGSGTITAGATITVGSAPGKVIGIYSAISAAPVLTGVATGFIKVKQWNNVAFPTSGTFTQAGYTFTINGASVKGWIGLEGDEAATITVPRLGQFNILGDWFDLGTTSGNRTTTYQLPTNGTNCYVPAVWVETSPGSGVYEQYINAGTLTALVANVATDDTRGKLCWVTVATGLLRFGNDGTNSTGGFLPVAGCKIRIPNVICNNVTTTARNAVALPNATLGTRYDFTTTGGGVVSIDKAVLNWYPSFSQAFSVQMTDTAVAEQVSISEISQPMNWSGVAVGQSAAQAQFALLMSTCFAGGTFTNCTWSRATLAASGNYVNSISDISGFTFVNEKAFSLVARANATTGVSTITRAKNCTWTAPVVGAGRHLLTTCANCTFTNPIYYDTPATTTGTTNPMSVVEVQSSCSNVTMNGLSLPVANNHPYTALLSVLAAGCDNIKLRNIGTRVSPLSLGSANQTGLNINIANGAAASNVRVQRVYTSATRTNVLSVDNSTKGFTLENVYGDFADTPVASGLNMVMKSIGGTVSVTAQTAIYGTHWFDCFTSATAGRIGILMNESTTETSGVYVLSGGAAFTSAGGLYMPTVGMVATFTTPYFIIGHTGFQNAAAVMGGGTIGNYTLEYDIDKGTGFSSTFKTLTGANLSAETGISASTGVRLKIRITTSVTNTTAITSLYVLTTSTAVAQDNQYPLDVATVNITGLVADSEVRAYVGTDPATAVEVAGTESSGTSFSFTQSVSGQSGYIQVIHLDYQAINFPIVYSSSDLTIPFQQQVDRNYQP